MLGRFLFLVPMGRSMPQWVAGAVELEQEQQDLLDQLVLLVPPDPREQQVLIQPFLVQLVPQALA